MKLQTLASVANHCFSSRTCLLFSVSSEAAAQYLDDLLWKFPPESFLPHSIVSGPSSETIGITLGLENFNQASVLFNLRSETHPKATSFSFIYEFYDETDPNKKIQSEHRKLMYLQQGLQVDLQ